MSYIARRLEFFVITVWAALTINFILPRIMPGNPGQAMLVRFHGRVSPQTIKALEVAFGINNNESIFQQYFEYLGNTLRGDFGTSLPFFPAPVGDIVKQGLPWTLGLVGMATIIAFALGTLIGMLSAWRRGGFLDAILPPAFIVISAFPYFWLGLLVLLVFAITLGWFPLGFAYDLSSSINLSWDFAGQVAWHGFLPALTIVITSIGGWILTMRNTMITTLAEDYVKMARAKGLSPVRIMFMYAGRNAILPNLVGFAMSLGFVISGAILVEIVFNYPGLGFMLLQAVHSEDYALMQTLFLMLTSAVLVAVLGADLLTPLLDPRTREQGEGGGAVPAVTHPGLVGTPVLSRRGIAGTIARGLTANRKAMAGLVLFGLFLVVAILAPVIAPYDPHALQFGQMVQPSGAHLLGTTGTGQDIFSQLVFGTRESLLIALAAGLGATVISVVVGVSAAYMGCF